jgi:hypothetical protein
VPRSRLGHRSGQSPTGMPATRDASNPHLNNWRASKELHPTSGLWRPVPRYEDRPKLAERGEPESESHAASRTVCIPDGPPDPTEVPRATGNMMVVVLGVEPSRRR